MGNRTHARIVSALLIGLLLSAPLPGCAPGRRSPADRAGADRVPANWAAADSAATAAHRRAVESDVSYARHRVAGHLPQSIPDRMARYGIRALSLAVIHDGRVAWTAAYGWADSAAGLRATPDTRFQPGSISKTLNALAVLRLVQAGRVDMDADVNRYLTAWRVPYDSITAGAVITPGMLLSHTAGLSVHGFRGYPPGVPLPRVVDILDGHPPAVNEPVRPRLAPGLRYKYSGGGTMILQQLLMEMTGRPYAALMADSVLGPLGMAASSFAQPPPPDGAPRARGYTTGGAPVPEGHMVMAEQAAAGLWTTPGDVARAVLEIQRARHGRGRLLARTMARLMTESYLPESPGLGVFLEEIGGERWFTHAAGNIGFSGVFYGGLERDDGVVVFVNSEEGLSLLKEVVATVAREYAWPGFVPSPPDTLRALPPPEGAAVALAGLYRDGPRVRELERRGTGLVLHAGAEPWAVYFSGGDTLFCEEAPATWRVARDAGGAVTGLVRLVEGDSTGFLRRVPEMTPPDTLLERLAGRYRDPDNEPLLLRRTGSGLVLEREETPRPARFLTPRDFFTREDYGTLFRVVTDAAGRPTAVEMTTANGTETCPRVGGIDP